MSSENRLNRALILAVLGAVLLIVLMAGYDDSDKPPVPDPQVETEQKSLQDAEAPVAAEPDTASAQPDVEQTDEPIKAPEPIPAPAPSTAAPEPTASASDPPEPVSPEQLPPSEAMASLKVSVSYLQQVELPATAQLKVMLLETAQADVAATEISSALQADLAAPPYQVTLEYAPEVIKNRDHYTLRAEVRDGAQLLMASTERIPAFSARPGQVMEVMMQLVGQRNPELTDTRWLLQKLESGTIRPRQNDPLFIAFEPNLRVSGFAGCNRFMGSYSLKGSQLEFGALASTKKYCEREMRVEQAYFAALEKVSHFRITNNHLLLMSDADLVMARFTKAKTPPEP